MKQFTITIKKKYLFPDITYCLSKKAFSERGDISLFIQPKKNKFYIVVQNKKNLHLTSDTFVNEVSLRSDIQFTIPSDFLYQCMKNNPNCDCITLILGGPSHKIEIKWQETNESGTLQYISVNEKHQELFNQSQRPIQALSKNEEVQICTLLTNYHNEAFVEINNMSSQVNQDNLHLKYGNKKEVGRTRLPQNFTYDGNCTFNNRAANDFIQFSNNSSIKNISLIMLAHSLIIKIEKKGENNQEYYHYDLQGLDKFRKLEPINFVKDHEFIIELAPLKHKIIEYKTLLKPSGNKSIHLLIESTRMILYISSNQQEWSYSIPLMSSTIEDGHSLHFLLFVHDIKSLIKSKLFKVWCAIRHEYNTSSEIRLEFFYDSRQPQPFLVMKMQTHLHSEEMIKTILAHQQIDKGESTKGELYYEQAAIDFE